VANRITTIFDFSESGGLKKVKADVDATDGSVNKLKSGWAGMVDNVKANAGMFAAAAGAALVTFGVKAVAAFTDAALAAGKFSDATGLSEEDASRWIEVAGDVGVSAETMEGAFVRLQKAVAANSPAFRELGIEVAKNKDGTTDANATMLNAIEALNGIKDSAKRTEAASLLFGRGFAQAAEVVLGDSKKMEAALKAVSDQQVFDKAEVEKARKLREALDNLQDTVEGLTLEFGGKLAPAVTDAAEDLQAVVDVAEDLKVLDIAGEIQKWLTPMSQLKTFADLIRGDVVFSIKDFEGSAADLRAELEEMGVSEELIIQQLGLYAKKQIEAAEATKDTTTATGSSIEELEAFEESVVNAEHALNSNEATLEGQAEAQRAAAAAADLHRQAEENLMNYINGQLSTVFNYETATHELANANTDLAGKIAEVQTAHENGELSGAEYETALRNLRLEEISTAEQARQTAIAFAESKGAADGSTASAQLQKEELVRLQAQFPLLREEIQAYIDILNRIPASRNTSVTVNGVPTQAVSRNPNGTNAPFIPFEGAGATGAIVNRPTVALIGESGPEAVVPLNRTSGNTPLPTGMSAPAGNTYSITVQTLAVTEQTTQALMGAIDEIERRRRGAA
jgi:hypothetical protein